MSETILAWHFVGDTLRDGRPIPLDGEWLVHDGPVVPCKSGLHASERIIDALDYAPGNTICRVEVRGDIQRHGGDKIVGRERRILWRIDGTDILRSFARQCALDVAHLWDIPPVVRAYLETGDKAIRTAAWDAAWAAARAAVRAAAWDAASAAASAAALAAVWDAARAAAFAAAWDAARAAAWDAARDTQNARLTAMVEATRKEARA